MKPRRSNINPTSQVTFPKGQVKPALFTLKREELFLSSQQLEELLIGVLEKGASFRFRGKGFSMSPFIKDGDLLTIAPLKESTPRFGDVVAFNHPSTSNLVIHRVVGKKRGGYLTKGDNIPEVDGFISTANIIGHVIKVERKGKEPPFGLGPARFVIGCLTRWNILSLLGPVWRFVRPMIRRRPGA